MKKRKECRAIEREMKKVKKSFVRASDETTKEKMRGIYVGMQMALRACQRAK